MLRQIFCGASGLDRSNYSVFWPKRERGTLVWDPAFDLGAPGALEAHLAMCDALETTPCTATGCDPSYGTLVVPGSTRCVLRGFASQASSSYARGDAGSDATASTSIIRFSDAVREWMASANLSTIERADLRFDGGGVLRGVRLRFEFTQEPLRGLSEPDAVTSAVNEANEFIRRFASDAPVALATSRSSASRLILPPTSPLPLTPLDLVSHVPSRRTRHLQLLH